MTAIISIKGLEKTYADGFEALKGVDLDIHEGEILALLGPNGAGKTTLISTVCGLVTPSAGQISVGGHDIASEFRAARSLIGLVPQEITIEPFEKVINTVRFSRGLFGKRRDDAHIEKVLRSLSLWEKRNNRNQELSGGMKRRVLIAKALSHEPRVLFLDEPTAGVDVTLRREMWELVRQLRADGVIIILTTHYIEEAEEMADRIGVIDHGRLLLVEEKQKLLHQLGRKELLLELAEPLDEVPGSLAEYDLELSDDRLHLTYEFDAHAERTGMTRLMGAISEAGLSLKDLSTRQSSLEDVFLKLVQDGRATAEEGAE
ncbi:ABC-2 type transport system ATP-binding protein [Aliiruegeria haliotis]|uniref:ABC-2 type transport system ATP-binding protein n=1 Tax=Aliiruegeria haliotis TaxID=1280846 RepID=A0A2T0RWE1_9RHOB|nr:ABC transporter ATP-binding protein [Aliiruegeria haliotis]PRY25491.1 ABC-2 type transport system ATP-binding protein [Aliiruegeria haliotis]